jgi:hypothetical protein
MAGGLVLKEEARESYDEDGDRAQRRGTARDQPGLSPSSVNVQPIAPVGMQ